MLITVCNNWKKTGIICWNCLYSKTWKDLKPTIENGASKLKVWNFMCKDLTILERAKALFDHGYDYHFSHSEGCMPKRAKCISVSRK
jgi:hypothetical protein